MADLNLPDFCVCMQILCRYCATFRAYHKDIAMQKSTSICECLLYISTWSLFGIPVCKNPRCWFLSYWGCIKTGAACVKKSANHINDKNGSAFSSMWITDVMWRRLCACILPPIKLVTSPSSWGVVAIHRIKWVGYPGSEIFYVRFLLYLLHIARYIWDYADLTYYPNRQFVKTHYKHIPDTNTDQRNSETHGWSPHVLDEATRISWLNGSSHVTWQSPFTVLHMNLACRD